MALHAVHCPTDASNDVADEFLAQLTRIGGQRCGRDEVVQVAPAVRWHAVPSRKDAIVRDLDVESKLVPIGEELGNHSTTSDTVREPEGHDESMRMAVALAPRRRTAGGLLQQLRHGGNQRVHGRVQLPIG